MSMLFLSIIVLTLLKTIAAAVTLCESVCLGYASFVNELTTDN